MFQRKKEVRLEGHGVADKSSRQIQELHLTVPDGEGVHSYTKGCQGKCTDWGGHHQFKKQNKEFTEGQEVEGEISTNPGKTSRGEGSTLTLRTLTGVIQTRRVP